jgi:hypothetical protein
MIPGSLRVSLIAGLAIILLSTGAYPFYEKSGDGSEIDLRLFLRIGGLWSKNPEDTFLYKNTEDSSAVGVGRLLAEGRSPSGIVFDANLLIGASLDTYGDMYEGVAGVERSGSLEESIKEEGDFSSRFTVDHLNVSKNFGRVDLKIGRQPVNFASTFYFTPNDFFAPFSAETFFRVYKPGVDAARVDVALGDLSLLSAVYVLGYRADPSNVGGWGNSPDSERASTVARVSAVLFDSEWAILGGVVRENRIAGGSIQGDIFEWLGVRFEGHVSTPKSGDPVSEMSLGLEHQFESTLSLNLEYFNHGAGSASASRYLSPGADPGLYLGKEYLAVGTVYQVSPLLMSNFLYITNLTDRSGLVSAYFVYSVSDEGEASLSLNLPFGEKPGIFSLDSEFGAMPISANLEYRVYY